MKPCGSGALGSETATSSGQQFGRKMWHFKFPVSITQGKYPDTI